MWRFVTRDTIEEEISKRHSDEIHEKLRKRKELGGGSASGTTSAGTF